jgi:pimeloyl-ACP methyl ester carboxylesterase
MKSVVEYEQFASERLSEAGFHEKTLEELSIPDIKQLVVIEDGKEKALNYIEMGDTNNAKHLVFTIPPYSTNIRDEFIQVRLSAQQAALGEQYALVGVQAHGTDDESLSWKQRKQVARGDFQPFADRAMAVMEHLKPRDDQTVSLYGYSMGADISTEVAYQNLWNVHRGMREIESLGVYEPARVMKRGAIAVAAAFASSGDRLFENVIDSDSPALNESRGIDPSDPKAKFKHDMWVNKTVGAASILHVPHTYAFLKGFGTPETVRQLEAITADRLAPKRINVAQMEESGITPLEPIERLPDSIIRDLDQKGDHSSADNVVRGAGFIMRSVGYDIERS